MSRKLDDLQPELRVKVFEFLARCVEVGLHVRVIETLRSLEQHKLNVAAGKSWVKRSKHCDGLAIDVGLVNLLALPNWAPEHPDWQRLGEIGEACGLKWGGRWKQKDMVHFEENNAA